MSLQGNGLVLGTGPSAGPLYFGTNNITRMFISTTGDIGIGTGTDYTFGIYPYRSKLRKLDRTAL